MFQCHLIYAIEIWSSAAPSIIRPIISKQKAVVRIIANKSYNDHSEPLFKQLSILPLKDLRVNLFNLKLFHSFVFYSIPVAFQNTWTTNREYRNYDNNDNIALRDDDDYHIPHYRTDYTYLKVSYL